MKINNIYNENCILGMRKIDNEVIDLTITSPPYNFGIMYDNYKDSLPIEEYRKNVQAVCNEIYRISTIGGRICINVPLVTKCFDTGRINCTKIA